MSRVVPNEIHRAIRTIVDKAVVPLVGQKAILYRYAGKYGDDDADNDGKRTAAEKGRELYGSLGDDVVTNSRFDDPIETRVFVNWTDAKKKLNDPEYRANLEYLDQVPIKAIFKFEDFVTPRSYIKTPYSLVRQQQGTKTALDVTGETQQIKRLEVENIQVVGQENEAFAESEVSVKRTSDDLHPDDDDLHDHIPNDFFDPLE